MSDGEGVERHQYCLLVIETRIGDARHDVKVIAEAVGLDGRPQGVDLYYWSSRSGQGPPVPKVGDKLMLTVEPWPNQ